MYIVELYTVKKLYLNRFTTISKNNIKEYKIQQYIIQQYIIQQYIIQ